MTVSLTGTSEDEVSRTVVRLDPGKYMVKDTSWDWAYDRPGPEIKPDELKVSSTITFGEGLVEYDRTVEFIFTGSEKSSTSTIKRSEDAKANNFTSVP